MEDTTTAATPASSDQAPFVAPIEDSADDQFLDVVVTSVDAVSPISVAQSFTSSSLMGYTVEFVVTKGATSYCMKRPLGTLYDVLNVIQATALAPTVMYALPVFPLQNSQNDAIIAQWCAQMTAFLAMHGQNLLAWHPKWLQFVTEREEDKGARMHMTAVDFILQPFPMAKVVIPRGAQEKVVMHVHSDNEMQQYIVWRFELEDYDVDFSVSYAPEPYAQPLEIIHGRTRYVSTTTGRAVEGSYRCVRPGTASFVWDNSYSRLRGKNVLYQVQVVSTSIMDSALAAADALDEAIQVEKARDLERSAALSTALIVSPGTLSTETPRYSAYLSEAIAQQSWLLTAPLTVAGQLAYKLFGSPEQGGCTHSKSARSDTEARSLVEELNRLNMQLLERLETLDDRVATLTAERDQARSKTHVVLVEKENVVHESKAREQELGVVVQELERMQRERQAWREIQAERDALLEEKHRWAMSDEFGEDDHHSLRGTSEMDVAIRLRREQELGQAEATVLKCRAELGYQLSNHLTGTSTRLERVAKDMAATKQQYEEQMQLWEHERLQLKQQLVKARGQRRVLVTEIRNLRTQSEGQIAVAMAEASEARMVNTRLKKQNEILLTQIRTLLDEVNEHEKKCLTNLQPREVDGQGAQVADALNKVTMPAVSATTAKSCNKNCFDGDYHSEVVAKDDHLPIPYTLNEKDIAMLNGRAPVVNFANELLLEQQEQAPSLSIALRGHDTVFRARLVAFFEERDPDKVAEVDEMLANYQGVEESLFESLELKYNFMELTRRIAQTL
ncbi:hypothetical protein CCR75_001988 [Bremia lactucae]|uniref:GOLD domain-containing protein n=1 Tax=Bremia lactucae TaxID=4779 RepID=A0A976IM00_BRELC|nr:hypothetical protein CCR75_001988 [Bremia lactucae]